jgi:hypothetical protein
VPDEVMHRNTDAPLVKFFADANLALHPNDSKGNISDEKVRQVHPETPLLWQEMFTFH